MASALTRSAGDERRAERVERRRVDDLDVRARRYAFSPSITPSGSNGSKNSRMRGSGVNRQSSSRPVGIGEVVRVARGESLGAGCRWPVSV